MTEIKVYALTAVSNIPAVVYWLLLVGLIVGGAIILLTLKTRKAQTVSLLLLIEWVLMIFCVTVIFRHSDEESSINLLPFWSYFHYPENSYLEEMAVINLLNVVMFMPVGLLLKCGSPTINWKRIFLIGGTLSVVIEISQFLYNKGLCEIDDIIHNVFGCMLGYGFAMVLLFFLTNIKHQTIDNDN